MDDRRCGVWSRTGGAVQRGTNSPPMTHLRRVQIRWVPLPDHTFQGLCCASLSTAQPSTHPGPLLLQGSASPFSAPDNQGRLCLNAAPAPTTAPRGQMAAAANCKEALQARYVGQSLYNTPTPALVLDLAKVEANCNLMLDAAQRLKLQWRAHIKTHKVRTLILSFCRLGAPWPGCYISRYQEVKLYVGSWRLPPRRCVPDILG